MAVKAVPTRGKLVGKKISGFLWAGLEKEWKKKENNFQLEHDKMVSAVLWTQAGAFWIRCRGATCKITMKSAQGKVLGTTILGLPRSGKK